MVVTDGKLLSGLFADVVGEASLELKIFTVRKGLVLAVGLIGRGDNDGLQVFVFSCTFQ